MLTPINTILYSTDLGKGMRPALRMAMSLAKQYSAKVTFLHVVEPINPTIYGWGNETLWKEIQHNNQTTSLELSNDKIASFFDEEEPGDDIDRPEIVIKTGRVAETVLKTADEINADIIVMGSHSYSALGELILGSVADKVMRISKKPVLLVPTEDKVND